MNCKYFDGLCNNQSVPWVVCGFNYPKTHQECPWFKPDIAPNGNLAKDEVCEFDKLNPPENPEDEQRCKGMECNYCGKFGNSAKGEK